MTSRPGGGGILVASGVALLAFVCCGAPILFAIFGAAALGGVLAIFHTWAALIVAVIAGAILVTAFVGRQRRASCATSPVVRRRNA